MCQGSKLPTVMISFNLVTKSVRWENYCFLFTDEDTEAQKDQVITSNVTRLGSGGICIQIEAGLSLMFFFEWIHFFKVKAFTYKVRFTLSRKRNQEYLP